MSSPQTPPSASAVRRKKAAAAALAGVCAVTLAGVGTLTARSATAAEPPTTRARGAVGATIDWKPCGPPRGLQCARIRVPLDWDRPNGRTIGLALVRHLASKPAQRVGTLFINPGGPGDTGVGLVSGDPEGVDAIGGGRFDVVSWDPRGTNASTPVRCFRNEQAEARFWAGASFPTTRAEGQRTQRRAAALARHCGEVSGWLLPHISTADTARDMDHLRRLVGEKRLTYVGLSYGSYLGQTYANMFPDRVRAMLLNAIVDPVRYSKSAEERVAMWSAAADEVFDRFLALCEGAGPQRCALAGGEQSPAQRWERLVARIERAPIPAPGADPPGDLSHGDLLISQFQPMRAPRSWPDNATELRAALGGDASALETTAGFFVSPTGWSAGTTSAAIQCADGPAREAPQAWPQVFRRQQRISPLSGTIHYAWEWAPCASWPVRGEDTYRGPWNASTPNPILLINQRFDPNSFYGNAVRAQRLLGNAVLLTHEGYGHLYFQNPSQCVEDAMVGYLTELTTPPNGTVCQSDQQPFDPGLR